MLFGRYRLVEPAGRGGTAQVWRAIDDRSGDEVAVKRLHPIVFASRAGRERLLREFRALRGLQHPNIVRVRDLELTEDEGALVLDYVPGSSVRDRLASGEALSEAEAVSIATDVADALAAAHAEGITHRDVSPGNILLDHGGRARLTDFGIARSDGETTVVTATGTLVGTLRYLAPEQLRGEDATPASDLYALGAVTYQMLAGRPAFEASTPVGLVEAQAAGPAPIDGVAPHLDAAVRRAMATDPADRQPSVAAFAQELVAPRDVATRAPAGAAPVAGIVAVVFGLLVVAALALGGIGDGSRDPVAGPVATPSPTGTVVPTDVPRANEEAKHKGQGDDKGKDGKAGEGHGKGNGKGKGNGHDD